MVDNTFKCPVCGSTRRDRGTLYVRGTLWKVLFKAATDSFFAFKQRVDAIACEDCGHIELRLANVPARA